MLTTSLHALSIQKHLPPPSLNERFFRYRKLLFSSIRIFCTPFHFKILHFNINNVKFPFRRTAAKPWRIQRVFRICNLIFFFSYNTNSSFYCCRRTFVFIRLQKTFRILVIHMEINAVYVCTVIKWT